MDQIHLTNLVFFGRHGVLPEETHLGQRFEVDLCLGLDLTAAGASDDVADTVNYAEVYEQVAAIVTGKPFRLIEALAARIVEVLLKGFPRLSDVEVTVRKPGAPVPGIFDTIAVTLRRSRP